MLRFLSRLSNTSKGMLLMATGALLFLYVIGLFAIHLRLLIIIVSIYMIMYGFVMMDGHTKLLHIIQNRGRKS